MGLPERGSGKVQSKNTEYLVTYKVYGSSRHQTRGGGIKKVLISPFKHRLQEVKRPREYLTPAVLREMCTFLTKPPLPWLGHSSNTQKWSEGISATYFWLDKAANPRQPGFWLLYGSFFSLLSRVLNSTETFSNFIVDKSSTSVPHKSPQEADHCAVGSQLTPVNGLLARLLQQLIGFRKMLTAKESSIH